MQTLYGGEAQRRHSIRDRSAIGAARRDSQRMASSMALDATTGGSVGLVVTELATNLLLHGGGGELFLQSIPTPSGSTIEVLAIDKGPGMASTEACLRDGYSSAGTPGTGLGAVKRLSAEFDIYSVVGRGTAVMARVGGRPARAHGAVCAPMAGEIECGDTWRLAAEHDRCALMVIDGLGHGSTAAAAAHAAAGSFCASPLDSSPQLQIERAHRALSATRGAAVACGAWREGSALAYAGIGNIAGRLFAANHDHGLVSHHGTLGFQMRRVQQFDYRAAKGDLLVMHSDGLSARWDLDDHAGLRYRHPAIIAATLYRDHARGRDDATVVVVTV